MIIEKRAYQEECLEALEKFRNKRPLFFKKKKENDTKRALVVMASGLGKTITSALDIKDVLCKKRGRVLFICDSNRILEQALETYKEILGHIYSYDYFNGENKTYHYVDILFASFQTMVNHHGNFSPDEFDYIVVDESHHIQAQTYREVIEYFDPKYMTSWTATPDRLDGRDIRDLTGNIVYELNLFDAITRGFLASVDYRLLLDNIVNSSFFSNKIAKLSITKLNREFFVPKRDAEIIKTIDAKIKNIANPRMMVFCNNINHAERFATLLGQKATVIHSSLNDELQKQRLDEFRSGKYQYIVSVNMLNEGVDVPEANVIVFLRSTVSQIVYFQQLGRGLRPIPGKSKVLILDFVANCDRVEMFNDLLSGLEKTKRNLPDSVDKDPSLNFIFTDVDIKFRERIITLSELIQLAKQPYSKKDLIDILISESVTIGGTPSYEHFLRNPNLPSPTTYATFFGSWNNALKAASLETTIEFRTKITDSQLLQELRDKCTRLGRVATHEEIDNDPEMASTSVYHTRFGGVYKALLLIGIKPPGNYAWLESSEEELLNILRDRYKSLGNKVPTRADMGGDYPTADLYKRVFKGWMNALEKAGLIIRHRLKSDEQLLDDLKRRYIDKGDPLFKRDFNNDPTIGSVSLYCERFKSWNNALKLAGLPITQASPTYKTQDEIVESMKRLRIKIGRDLKQSDIANLDINVSKRNIERECGSWSKACSLAGMNSRKKAVSLTDEQLISILKKANKILSAQGKKLTIENFEKLGLRVASSNYYRRFGSWNKAVELAGSRRIHKCTDIELSNDVIRVNKLIGDVPLSATLFDKHTETITAAAIVRRFKVKFWIEVLEKLNISTSGVRRPNREHYERSK